MELLRTVRAASVIGCALASSASAWVTYPSSAIRWSA